MNYDHTCPYCGYPTYKDRRCPYCADSVLDAKNLQRIHTDAVVMGAEKVAEAVIYDVIKPQYCKGKIAVRAVRGGKTKVCIGRNCMTPCRIVGMDRWKLLGGRI